MSKILNRIKGLIKGIFGKRGKEIVVKNPWAGLSSYEDPIIQEEPLKFCGRDEETIDVFSLIDDNIIITLYGKSGIGKTSLLNAGVFPLLRKNNYAPLYVRFIANGEQEDSFASQLVDIISERMEKFYGKDSIEIIDVVPENTDPDSEDFLWSFFARRRFSDQEGNAVFPVLVLDQFEENIRINRKQAALLLKQIAYISNPQNKLKDSLVNDQYYVYDYNFRFVISIREDDLFRLEDIINSNYLSLLRNGRYRLQNLKQDSAQSIVRQVGSECIDSENIDLISERIVDFSKDKEDGLIQTNAISLICSRLFDIVSNNGKRKITLHDVESYLSSDPFEEYYANAVKGLSEGEKRIIETKCVSADGRRNLLPETTLKESIRSYDSLTWGGKALFHRLQSASGEYLTELIHDGLCPIVLKHRTSRLERKNKAILTLCLLIYGVFSLWMLHASIVNNIVDFFLSLGKEKVSSDLRFIRFLSVPEILSVVLTPIAIASVVYDYKKKKWISGILMLILLSPCFFYPVTFFNHLERGFVHIGIALRELRLTDVLGGFSDNAYVFMIYAASMIGIALVNFFGKPGMLRSGRFFKILLKSSSLRIYYFVIIVFLFCRSVYNDGSFITDSFDSCWGLVVIPLLLVILFNVHFTRKRQIVAFCVYAAVMLFLMICSLSNSFIPASVLLYILAVSSIVIFAIFYEGNIFKALLKTLCNIALLFVVVYFQQGYNPSKIESNNIYKVYPWRTVITKNGNKFGATGALYGDTVLSPLFFMKNSRDPGLFYYYTYLSGNSFIKSIPDNVDSIGTQSVDFPMRLKKTGDGEWKLSLMYPLVFERSIIDLAHISLKDSTFLVDKEGADLFIKLRNGISKFCITGKESELFSLLPYIENYEKVVKHDLSNSLEMLKKDYSVTNEYMATIFMKALSRATYMNMLKVAILRGHYTNFIEWYSSYYLATSLSRIAFETGIRWSNIFSYSFNLQISSYNNSSSENRSNSLTLSFERLNEDRIYGWNDLFTAFYVIEFNAYAGAYASNIERMSSNNTQIYESIKKNAYKVIGQLNGYLSQLENQQDDLKNILSNLSNLGNSGKDLNTDEITQTIKNVLDINDLANNVKKGVSFDTKSFLNDTKSLLDSCKIIKLRQADIQYNNIVNETFNSLLETMINNPNNVYNGLFSSVCQKLYILGIIRKYNMGNYKDQIYKITEIDSVPGFKFVRNLDRLSELQKNELDSLKEYVGFSEKVIRDKISKWN